jgi:hypothetical protein
MTACVSSDGVRLADVGGLPASVLAVLSARGLTTVGELASA